MTDRIASAVFDSREDAERALSDLRTAGVDNEAISIIGKTERGDGDGIDEDGDGADGSGAVKGALLGGGGGALLGLAALAIPGVGPLAAAGAIAASAAPGAAGIGAALGATAGGIAGLMTNEGVDEDDAKYYESSINDGGYFVGVHTDKANLPSAEIREILYRAGGHSASRQRVDART